MTTRLRLFAYHAIGAVSLCGTLLAVAPALAPVAVGFSAVYLAVLAVLYVAGRLAGMGKRGAGLRVPAMLFGCVVLWLTMTALDPAAGVFALLLAFVSLWPRRLAA